MAIASTRTMLPLDRWAAIVGVHPLHFNQVTLPNLTGGAQVCGEPILQYSWQHADRVGREEIAQAIAMAEDNICYHLGFKILPQWETEEIVTPRGKYSPLRTTWKYVISGGSRASSLIDDNVAITYTDVLPGETYKELATISVATTVTDPDEIRIYYPGHSGEDAYEIRPITVTLASGIATIKCKRHQLVIESALEEMLDPRSVDGIDNAKFLTVVDVYRVYNDPSVQAQLISFDGGCCAEGCTTCQYASNSGCLSVANSRNGIVHLQAGTWNADDAVYDSAVLCTTPAKVQLFYRAGKGYGSSRIAMDPMWERAIAYYSLTFLDRPLCKCNAFAGFAAHWRTDLAERSGSAQGGFTAYALNGGIRECPLGTTRGAINAWRLIQKEMVGEAG